jgi:hypothetical protein
MRKMMLAAALVCAALLGCGGGSPTVCTPLMHPVTCAAIPGGDGSLPGAVNNPTESAGLWQGITSNGRKAYGVLLSDGTYWFIYTAMGNPSLIAGVGQGTATSIDGTLTSTNGLDFNLEGLGVTAASITATYSPRVSISGTVRYPTQSVSFTASYVDVPPAALSQIAGSYRGTAAVVSASETVNVTISASGTISGVGASGCSFTGAAAPRIDVAVFDVTVTFAGGICALGTSTVRGVAFYDTGTGHLISAALNTGRTNGFLALGAKI